MSTVKTGIPLHMMANFLKVRLHSPVQQPSFYATGVGSAWLGGYLLSITRALEG